MALHTRAVAVTHARKKQPMDWLRGRRGARILRNVAAWLFARNVDGGSRTTARASGWETTRGAAERAQFEDLFARFHLPLLDFLYGMTRDREVAADLAQETFLRAYAARSSLDSIAYPQAWLYRIAT